MPAAEPTRRQRPQSELDQIQAVVDQFPPGFPGYDFTAARHDFLQWQREQKAAQAAAEQSAGAA